MVADAAAAAVDSAETRPEALPDAAASSSADQDHVAEREAERGLVLMDVQPASCSESSTADGGSLPASDAVPTRTTDPRLTRARRRQALKPQRRRTRKVVAKYLGTSFEHTSTCHRAGG